MRRPDVGGNRSQMKEIRRRNRVPSPVIVAELFLIVMVAVYIIKVGLLAIYVSDGAGTVLDVAMTVIYLVLMMTAMSAIMGLSSRRVKSWRKVMRNCITFSAMSFVSAFLLDPESITHSVDMNPFLTMGVLVLVMAMMLVSGSVKEFYTPTMVEVKPVSDWLRYVFVGKLYDESYEIVRQKSE